MLLNSTPIGFSHSGGPRRILLGSLVDVKVDEATEVYDGQQRLATSMILVAAVRDYFLRNGDEKTAGIIEGESLYSENRETHELQPHFRLNAEDHHFFATRVLARSSTAERKAATKESSKKDSHKRIAAAAQTIRIIGAFNSSGSSLASAYQCGR